MCAAALFFMMTSGLVLAADTTKAEPVQAVAAATQAKAKTAQAAPVQQTYSLDLDTTKYEKKTMTVDGKKVAFRAYENRVYVAHPVDTTYQSMNIYVPEGYFKGQDDQRLYGEDSSDFPAQYSRRLYAGGTGAAV